MNFNYDLDYSKDRNIDKRVLEICAIAEAKYLEELKNKKKYNYPSKDIEVNDLIINNNSNSKRCNTINELKKTLETSRSNVQNKSYFTGSKLGRIENKSIDFENNLLSQKFYNKNAKFKSPTQRIQNINSFIISKIPKNINNNYNHIQMNEKNNNISNSQNNYFLNNLNKTQTIFTPKSINNIINVKSLEKGNAPNNMTLIQKKYKPLFSNSINKNYILKHNIHIKNKNKYELNKILLQSQSFIKNHKYMHAYYLLRNTIAAGEYHSDLFYLYGEVNRILKNYEEAEDYLLLALNFEIHSPYVFYSMGLLYQNLNQYNYSNIFLRLFQRLINNDNVHYLISKNYMKIGDLLKAAKEMTIAIKMKKKKDIYYKFRSEIYNKMGMNEMSNEDLSMYNYIKNINIEENK